MFARFMMLTVIINCGFMTLSEPPPFVENVLEHVFMTIYTLECIVKVIAKMFYNKFFFNFFVQKSFWQISKKYFPRLLPVDSLSTS